MDTIYKLSKEYDNEGTAVSEIDFSKLQEADAGVYIKAYNIYQHKGYTEYPPERTEEFAEIIASLTTDLPIEFYDGLGANDMRKIRDFVRKLMYNKPENEAPENIITLCRPVTVNEKEISKLDFSNLENITTITLKKANNAIRRRGIYIVQNKEFDMRYALAIAEEITGIEDLSKISIQDGIEIRNRVADFFVFGS